MNHITPGKALSKAYLKYRVLRDEIEQFKSSFITLSSKVKPNMLEEQLKNDMRDFLLDAYYKGKYEINIKDRKDLVIHAGPKSSDNIAVIIEAKAIKNKAEMVTKGNLNAKALQETLLYYLRERVDKDNSQIKHLIITNVHEWFLFDGNDFEKLVYRNTKLIKAYKEYVTDKHDTKYFYDNIAKPFIDKIKDDITYTWFDIRDYEQAITNDDLEDDTKLIALFKLLSPTHILKLPFANDSNTLNKDFYKELLYIIGLEEIKVKNKKIIGRVAEANRQPASLLENTMTILQYESNISEEKRYETALELCITWINRILFLKLLESQLIKYHKGDKSYQFLHHEKIENYDLLNKLFFQVLAIRPENRRPNIQAEYKDIPYLNSSLFEVSEIEKETSIKISNLEDSEVVDILSNTALRDHKHKKQSGKVNTLSYLLQFLDAYDFSSEGGEPIKEEDKSLINASVLGLIFEKINGYKDGSFFTPGFITMYMCKETLEKAVIQKFNEAKKWSCDSIEDIKENIDNRKEANDIINSIKVCDPAVGSGHFLVSMLNEFIALKSYLGILSYADGKRVKYYKAEVDNDELIVTDEEDDIPFVYHLGTGKKPARELQDIQMMLFHEKMTIIENCLFGVDINPNSVKICRLRLWIELLKNAYYTEESNYTDLETLPNIDINIKCGNSLISRFDLDTDLSEVFDNKKYSKENYLMNVTSYKSTNDKAAKQEIKDYLNKIKAQFTTTLYARDPRKKKLSKLRGQLTLIDNAENIGDLFEKLSDAKISKNKTKLQKQIDKIEKDLNEEEDGKFYDDNNAFEWRFEFPEVLDEDGGYEGFDVVIGNPPYGLFNKKQNQKISLEVSNKLISILKNQFPIATGGVINASKMFYAFSLKISSNNGFQSMIIPFGILTDTTSKRLRKHLLNECSLYKIDAFPERDSSKKRVFEDAKMSTAILITSKKAGNNRIDIGVSYGKYIEHQKRANLLISDLINLNPDLVQIPLTDSDSFELLTKIYSQNEIMKFEEVSRCLTGEVDMTFGKEALTKKPTDVKLFKGVQIDRYLIKEMQEEISQGEIEFIDSKIFKTIYSGPKSSDYRNRRIALQGLSGVNEKFRLKGAILNNGYLANSCNYIKESTLCSLEVLLAFFNSKLLNFVFKTRSTSSNVNGYEVDNLPIILSKNKDDLQKLVYALKLVNSTEEHLLIERKIDLIIFNIFNLTHHEVKIIDPDFPLTEPEYEAFEVV